MGRIELRGIRCWAHIGVTDEERTRLQELRVDLRLYVDLSAAAESDRISETVDYSELASRIQKETSSGEFRLLESLATHLCRKIVTDPRIQKTRIRVRKRPTSMREDLDWVAVELSFSRDS